MTTKPPSKITDLVPVSLLNFLQKFYLNYLHTSATIYERDGAHATSMITSRYCNRLADACEAKDGKGEGICHKDRWRVSKKSIDLNKPYNEKCSGGLIIHSVPIMLNGTPIGAANAAVSNPPKDVEAIKKIAERFKKYEISIEEIKKLSEEHEDYPEFVLDAAKRQVETVAKTVATFYEIFYKLHLKEEDLAKQITRRKQAEEKLQHLLQGLHVHQKELKAQNNDLRQIRKILEESRNRYADLYDFSPLGYVTLDGIGCIRDINLTGATLLGRKQLEAAGMSFSSFVDKSAVEIFYNHLQRCKNSGDEVVTEALLRVKDGRPVDVQLSSLPVYDAKRRAILYRTVITDITKRKQAELALKRLSESLEQQVTERTAELTKTNEELRTKLVERKRMKEQIHKLSHAVEQSPVAVIITSTEGDIEYVNPYFTQLTGYTSEEVIGQNPRILKSGETPPEEHKRLWETITSGGTWRGEFYNKKKNGDLYWEYVSISPIKNAEGVITHFVAVEEDVTERKQIEEERKHSLERLQKALGGTIQALVAMVEMRDPYTSGHQRRVADLAPAIAAEMGLSSELIEGIRMAGAIHDIGKIAVPAEILSKPGKITETEFEMIKAHSQIGYNILKGIEFPWPVAKIVLQHQERMDGSGYPAGLSNGKIILEARILAVADVVEAMSSHRPYRPALGIDTALEGIFKNRGILYDSDAVDACVKLFREGGFKFE
ncbi:MAG: hypothetical protein A3C38_02295 [Planctomycetes bacterium RIFCSPHIGHO2_02_FULL_50_42]|nr:MAG: hypothetical protein A3C38_02295 [Planctomycetes bacterium RIFCSPHIGHO2_02_FULL_50_42]OHB91342.1 MAG: hypothetical protein A3E75_05465 [Planctomycetes bacterium RIFCSPHIGHO2_12_FULL_51_37]OHB96497.1 MAG: hypothetical protein A3I59_08530 [Planctomycetes bacterium RIFCSPLOWO2_02_FULL_50_16]OHC02928.1 MAG: hypothetical protein A3G17_02480 [Planctomycetes bacterium RIFCSPLOWO2_12_FULL_50_35]